MIRFIDLRKQETGYNFAWFDTGIDKFKEFSDFQTWDDWDDFVRDYDGDDIERYRILCPAWVFGVLLRHNCSKMPAGVSIAKMKNSWFVESRGLDLSVEHSEQSCNYCLFCGQKLE